MQSEGRIEKRAAVQIPARLMPAENNSRPETTTIINVSALGACVLTSRRWRPGEQLTLFSASGEFRRQATVVYCRPLTNGQFCAGLEFGVAAPWVNVAIVL
jgi:PilZ domain-containing protein